MPQVEQQLRRVLGSVHLLQALQQLLALTIVLLLLHLALVFYYPEARLLGRWTVLVSVGGYALYLLCRRTDHWRADQRLGLRDRLATWAQLRGRGHRAVAWLDADLDAALHSLPAARLQGLRRRPLRRSLLLLPLLLLLVWFLDPLGFRLDLPSRRGQDSQAQAPSQRGGGGAGQTPRGAGDPRPGAEQAAGAKPQTGAPSAPQPQPSPQQEAPPAVMPLDAPRPIPKLGVQEEFVMPRFVGADGGRREVKRVAVVEEGAASAPPPVALRQGARVDPRQIAQQEFRKALETTLRARQVPAAERNFVRRYFEALSRAGR